MDSRPAPAHFETARELAITEPWVDVHAHPGRCFLGGMGDSPVAEMLGGDASADAVAAVATSAVTAASFATVADLLVLGVSPEGGISATRDFEPGEAAADHERQLRALVELAGRPDTRMILTAADYAASQQEDQVGMLLCAEGGDFLEGSLEGLAPAHNRGLRSVTLVHYHVNELGDIQTEPARHGGLTPFGTEVVEAMNELGMIVDLAHATWDVTRMAIDVSTDPVMISHSHLMNRHEAHPRLLTDEHARAVADTGGVIGAWPAGFALVDMEDFVTEIIEMIDVAGSEHVAVGTDMDANYQPVLTDYDQFEELAARLLARGTLPDTVARVMGRNMVRLTRDVCG